MQIVVNQILIGLIAALGCLIGGTLMLPTLATDELREVLANIIQTSGYSISGYASRIFPPEQVHCQKLFHVEAAAHFPQTHKLATAVSGYASCTCRTCYMCLHLLCLQGMHCGVADFTFDLCLHNDCGIYNMCHQNSKVIR